MIFVLVFENLAATFLLLLHLFSQTGNRLFEAVVTAFQVLNLQLQLVQPVFVLPGGHTRLRQALLQGCALGLQAFALIGVFADGGHGFLPFQPQCSEFFGFELMGLGHFCQRLIQLVGAQRQLFGLGLLGRQTRFQLHQLLRYGTPLALGDVALLFQRLQTQQQAVEIGLVFFHRDVQIVAFGVEHFQLLLPCENTAFVVGIAGDAQPVGTDPDAIAGNHRFVRRETAAHGQRLRQIIGGFHLAKQTAEGFLRGDLFSESTGSRSRITTALPQGQHAFTEAAEPVLGCGHIVDQHRLQIIAEYSLGGGFPAVCHLNALRQTRTARQLMAFQPVGHSLTALPQCGFLQGLKCGFAAQHLLQFLAFFFQRSAQLLGFFPC